MTLHPALYIWFFALGAAIGSFANVCVYRLPRELSVVYPRSSCIPCGNLVRFYDNVPLLSFLWLGGRCRSCGSIIGIRYPLIELLTAFTTVFVVQARGISFQSFYILVAAVALIIVSAVDLEHRIIPDVISIPGIWIGVAAALLAHWLGIRWWVTWKESMLGLALGGGLLWGVGKLYEGITGREGIGFGDVKLLALFGASFGPAAVVTSLFFASLLGAFSGLTLMTFWGKGSKYPIPFGPFLCLGLLIHAVGGQRLIARMFF